MSDEVENQEEQKSVVTEEKKDVVDTAVDTGVVEATAENETVSVNEVENVTENENLSENEDNKVNLQEPENTEEIETVKTIETVNAVETLDPNDHILRVSSLYKQFGHKKVVRGVEFSMHVGEVLGLLGPNGAGKTTTFYMVVGFYKPTQGDVFLDEQRITGLPMYKRARLGIAYLPQEPSVFRKFTVEENIWSILETRKDLTKAEKKERLESLIEEFSIGRIRKQKAYTLSGGERRRTEIARSLALEPKFLLLDEPFAGIDPIAVADIKSMIRLLAKRGIGILITDHNVRDTLEITDRAIIINQGTIMIQGKKEEILASEVAREIYLGKDFSM